MHCACPNVFGMPVLGSQAREYETLFKSQKMIINPYSAEAVSRYGPGFVVVMKPEEARTINAPNNMEFREMLTKQLSEERLQGKNYCPNGYEFTNIIYSMHWYTEISFSCKN